MMVLTSDYVFKLEVATRELLDSAFNPAIDASPFLFLVSSFLKVHFYE